MKHTWITRLLSAIFPFKVIMNCNHDPYLIRWYVFKTKRVTLFIHKFVRSDEDRALHDHPWPFLVIPIWRGYWEHSYRPSHYDEAGQIEYAAENVRRRVLPIIGTRYRSALYRHRVELLKDQPSFRGAIEDDLLPPPELPAWSLFFHFKREREWGFHPPEGFIPWQKWWSDKCE